jgi:hypothetical protein
MTLAVVALFSGLETAEEALDYLISASFSSQDISVVMRDAPKVRLAAGTLGLLEGIRTVSIAGAGSFVTAGPISNAISESEALQTGLEARLSALGMPGTSARRFAGRLTEGAVLLLVHCGNVGDEARALEVLRAAGAEETTTLAKALTSSGANPGYTGESVL